MNVYPLKFTPILKERLWGGTKLRDILGKSIESEITGESWEISTVKGDVSIIDNGELSGSSLQGVIDEHSKAILGESVVARFGKEFPILIKFIDAKQDLSIQLHPNDELAKARHDSFGKTEMWYIMDADKDANLIVGFNTDVTKEEYRASLEAGNLLDILNYEVVKEGDTFFINTGKIHAIGAGVVLAEIQQTSDITYRVYDFNRKDKNGNLRELHTDMALDAIDYTKKDDFKVSYDQKEGGANSMVDSPYFKTNFISVTSTIRQDVSERDSFTIYICVGGEAQVENEFGSVTLKKGETTLLGANCETIVIKSSNAKLLEVTI